MRWIWIDRILELDRGQRCAALKNVSLAEDVLHDHWDTCAKHPTAAVMPNTLIIEGMAQTAGILIGHARDFREKVILAKISRARFTAVAPPGYTLRFDTSLERLDDHGASTSGTVTRINPANGKSVLLAKISLTFSHIDQSRSDHDLPEHNFVFTSQFMALLRSSGFDVERHAGTQTNYDRKPG